MRRGVHSLEASCTHPLFYRSRSHPRPPLLATPSCFPRPQLGLYGCHIRACLTKSIFIWPLFSITSISCAKKRVEHAGMPHGPTLVTGQPAALKLFPPPAHPPTTPTPKSQIFRGQKMKIPGGKLLLLLSTFLGPNWVFTLFFGGGGFCHSSISTLANNKPSRLIRPRPIDCDRGSEQPTTIFSMFASIF